jgi:hypothetical protein
MRMKRKKLIWMFVLILAMLGWTFRPYPKVDETKVHPSLRGLADSTECGWTSWGDGGSVAILIRPTGGSEIDLCLSNSVDQSFFERGELYIGALYYTDSGSTKITGYDHSKYVVAKLLAKHIPKDPSVRSVIALLTMRASDWVSSFVHGDGSPIW